MVDSLSYGRNFLVDKKDCTKQRFRNLQNNFMQTYITQLIEHLQEAKVRKPAPRYLELPEEMQGLEDLIDLEISMEEDGPTMEALFGIPKYYFPPIERLTNDQMEQLVAAILDLWWEFHYEADLPKNIPARYAYPVLVACWKKAYPLVRASNGTWHIEFCNYEPNECPFPEEYCHCKRYLEEYNTLSSNEA